MNNSDPLIADIDRTGDDVLFRIEELTDGKIGDDDKHGWRPLLVACAREINNLRDELESIRDELREISEAITSNEVKRSS